MEPEIEDGRATRARKLRRERRAQILDAAISVFAAKGFHAASIDDIVRASHSARGTFYLYFPSKRALFDAVLDSILDELDRNIHHVDISPGAPPPLDQLEQTVTWLLSLPTARPEVARILLQEAIGLDAEFDRKLDRFNERMYALTQSSLDTGIEMGLVRPCDTRVAARCVVGVLKESMLSLVMRHDVEDLELGHLARQLLAFCARGLMPAARD